MNDWGANSFILMRLYRFGFCSQSCVGLLHFPQPHVSPSKDSGKRVGVLLRSRSPNWSNIISECTAPLISCSTRTLSTSLGDSPSRSTTLLRALSIRLRNSDRASPGFWRINRNLKYKSSPDSDDPTYSLMPPNTAMPWPPDWKNEQLLLFPMPVLWHFQ